MANVNSTIVVLKCLIQDCKCLRVINKSVTLDKELVW